MLTEQQKLNRRNGIGASEAFIAMNLCPKMSAYQLWEIKTGRKEPESLDGVPVVKWGNWLESLVATDYEELTGVELEEVPETLYHKDYPFILCHLDRKVKGEDIAVEIKTTALPSEEWGESNSDIVPERYIIQVQHQLAVTGYQKAILICHFKAFSETRSYEIKRDDALIARIESDLKTFWHHIETNSPPALRDRSDVLLAYPSSNGNYIEADLSMIETVMQLKDVKEKLKAIDAEKKSLENKLALYLQDHDGLRCDDRIIATFKSTARGRTLRLTGATL